MEISVIIPTYNNIDNLKLCIQALERQSYPKTGFEVIIVDDGSKDEIKRNTSRYLQGASIDIKLFESSHRGPAAARNTGIEASSGNLLLFIGDDIMVSEDFIYEHINAHSQYPSVACLGLTLWHESVKVSDFHHGFMAPYGIHFSYHSIPDPFDCGYGFFYTSNISLEKYWFEEERFDEDFKYAAQEDVELSYRLHKKGLRIVFNEHAVAYHRHNYTQKAFFERRKLVGRAMALMVKKHPELLKDFFVRTPWKLHLFRMAGTICPFLRIKKKYKYLYWELKARKIALYEMKRNLRDGLRE